MIGNNNQKIRGNTIDKKGRNMEAMREIESQLDKLPLENRLAVISSIKQFVEANLKKQARQSSADFLLKSPIATPPIEEEEKELFKGMEEFLEETK